jgi:hypothetical protein
MGRPHPLAPSLPPSFPSHLLSSTITYPCAPFLSQFLITNSATSFITSTKPPATQCPTPMRQFASYQSKSFAKLQALPPQTIFLSQLSLPRRQPRCANVQRAGNMDFGVVSELLLPFPLLGLSFLLVYPLCPKNRHGVQADLEQVQRDVSRLH